MSGAGDDSAHDHLQQQVIRGGLNIDNFDSDTCKCTTNVFTLKLSQNIKLKTFFTWYCNIWLQNVQNTLQTEREWIVVNRYLDCGTLVISPNWSSSSRNKAVSSSRCREDNGYIAGTSKQWKQLVGANWSGPDSVLRSSDTFRVGACSAAAAAARRVRKKYRTWGPNWTVNIVFSALLSCGLKV